MAHASLLSALDALEIKNLPAEWVDAAWSHSLVDFEGGWPLPSPLNQAEDALEALRAALADWQESSAEDSLWVALADNGVPLRNLIAVLAFVVDTTPLSKPQPPLAAAAAYMRLLALPGASAHQVFAGMLLRTAFKVLMRAATAITPVGKKTKASKAKSGGRSKNRGSADGENDNDGGDDEEMEPAGRMPSAIVADDEEDPMADEEDTMVTYSAAAIAAAKTGLADMVHLLRMYSLRENAELLDLAAQVLTSFVVVGVKTEGTTAVTEELFHAPISGSQSWHILALQGLAAACSSSQTQDNSNHIRVAVKHMLPLVNLTWAGVSSGALSLAVAGQTVVLDFLAVLAKQAPPADMGRVLKLMLQHLCMSVPDRAEYRQHGATAVVRVAQLMPMEDRMAALAWVLKFAHNSKNGYRTLAIDIAAAALQSAELLTEAEQACLDTARNLFELVVARCSDRAPAVRTKALTQLAALLEAARMDCSRTLPVLHATTASAWQQSTPSTKQLSEELSLMLMRRLADTKGTVRKAAVQAMEACLLSGDLQSAPAKLDVLAGRCSDAGLNVRKQALMSLHNILGNAPTVPAVLSTFVQHVLPMVMDREDSIRNKCIDVLHSVILAPLVERDAADMVELAWRLLQTIDSQPESHRFLRRACAEFARGRRITQAMINRLQKGVKDERPGAWLLLGEVSSISPTLLDVDFVLSAWYDRDLDNASLASSVLRVLGGVATHMEAAAREALVHNLRQLLMSLSVPPPVIAAGLLALSRLAEAGAGVTMDTLAAALLRECEAKLMAIGQDTGSLNHIDELAVARYVFALGDSAVYCPAAVTPTTVQVIEAIVAHEANNMELDATASSALSLAPKSYSPTVRAHAYLALGKLCLQQESLTKKWLAAMARELETCSSPAVRNNIVVVMSDLCVLYPTSVSRYLPTLALGLRDESSLVRRQTLALLTRLLSEDYIKLRDSLLFRLLATLVDEDPTVRQLGLYCIVTIIHKKDPSALRTHFVEAIFTFNNARCHPKYNCFAQTETERAKFDLSGDDKSKQRSYIYRMMLEPLTDLDKLQLTHMLCTEVLGSVVDGALPLSADLEPVLRDILAILASKDIKLGSSASEVNADGDEEEAGALTQARNKLVSKLNKKNLVENIVPILLGLKNLLEKRHSPLLRSVLAYLCEISADHKQELEEILASDRQLAQELVFDLKKFEQASRRASVASLAATPTHHMTLVAAGLDTAPPASASGSMQPSPLTPGFAPPRVRGAGASTMQRSKSGLRSVASASALNATMDEPASAAAASAAAPATPPRRATAAPAAALFTPKQPASTTATAAPTGPLAWVRTPASKSRKTPSTGAAVPAGADILLDSPMGNANSAPPATWKLNGPLFAEPRAEKRMATEDLEAENADPLLLDTELVAVPASKKQK